MTDAAMTPKVARKLLDQWEWRSEHLVVASRYDKAIPLARAYLAEHDARVAAEADLAAMTARCGELEGFIAEFAAAKIEALRYQPAYGESPEDAPDPVVEATEVWAWQEDARAALKETPNA